jgi:hypothetical protein
MPLKMRPPGLGRGFYKDNVDYGVFCGEWCIGRTYETRVVIAGSLGSLPVACPPRPGAWLRKLHLSSICAVTMASDEVIEAAGYTADFGVPSASLSFDFERALA